MPRKRATRRTPPKGPKTARRENAIGGEHPQRQTGEDEIIAERRVRAFGLRKAGASYRQIAQQLAVSLNTAWADVNAELLDYRDQVRADVVEVRELELQRCDEMILGLWPAVRRGDPRSVIAAIRVADRRAKLLGIDAPTQLQHLGAMPAFRVVKDDRSAG